MGINWKNKEATDKLIGAMLAAHPTFKVPNSDVFYDSIPILGLNMNQHFSGPSPRVSTARVSKKA
jgi:hypothetical protein